MFSLLYADAVRSTPDLRSALNGPMVFPSHQTAISHLFTSYVGHRLLGCGEWDHCAEDLGDDRVLQLEFVGVEAFAQSVPEEFLKEICDWYFALMNDEMVAAFYDISPLALPNSQATESPD